MFEKDELDQDEKLFSLIALARKLGQSEEILKKIQSGISHPAMAAFGLWKNEADLENLSNEIRKNREL